MRGILPSEPFVVCPTNQSILGNCRFLRLPLIGLLQNQPSSPPAPQRHWDPVTSQEGDGRSSGPGSPGLDNLGKNPYAADEAAFNGSSNGKSAIPRTAFALSGLAAALVVLL